MYPSPSRHLHLDDSSEDSACPGPRWEPNDLDGCGTQSNHDCGGWWGKRRGVLCLWGQTEGCALTLPDSALVTWGKWFNLSEPW